MARRARDSKGRFKSKRRSSKRKRRSSKKRSSRGKTTCKVVNVCGKKRKICWGPNGIKSNRPVGRGGKVKKSSGKGKWVRVSKKKATYSSGKKKGKLKPGCKFTKGGTYCRK